MLTSIPAAVHTLDIRREVEIAAPAAVVFDTLLEQLGPHHETAPGYPLPMTLEAWPGGRWYRDLGSNTGHYWGHVQVIKPPRLLEICGPLFMSYPAVSHLQYRLTEEGGMTRLTLIHGVMGRIPPEHLAEMGEGMEPWTHTLHKVRERAEERSAAGRPGR
ncbi:MAG TPA: SRPBCC domain-containing protein [bacterium]|nr:SRPBCC domain-containing protein [bacterium]